MNVPHALGELIRYAYTIGGDWHDYNSEQQAEIVEEWFSRGEPTGSADHWPYTRDYVRRGRA